MLHSPSPTPMSSFIDLNPQGSYVIIYIFFRSNISVNRYILICFNLDIQGQGSLPGHVPCGPVPLLDHTPDCDQPQCCSALTVGWTQTQHVVLRFQIKRNRCRSLNANTLKFRLNNAPSVPVSSGPRPLFVQGIRPGSGISPLRIGPEYHSITVAKQKLPVYYPHSSFTLQLCIASAHELHDFKLTTTMKVMTW